MQRDGTPQLLVDGKPFFFFGGPFFYARIPPERWRAAMLEMRAAGANTLDLYVPWNWHETADRKFDFDGHTNPRRNLRRVLRLARELHFHLIVRPGPVIRNEWRNGGYPDWLLRRPAYRMPLHDVLEGRYPATATLQNAHSDDAAAEWMRNATHRYYAARWLHHALIEFAPYADLVIAVALDDDQGAYIDNQTWPAPHLHAYLHWLDAQVRSVTGPVDADVHQHLRHESPGLIARVGDEANWYQSDAYALGEHDRGELDFATATLTTQENVPLASSEFQAGWLASPEDPLPRPVDPSNTTLALAEMLSWGVHGVVDFPLQDTLAPFGWEAPFSNAFYTWDAAIPRDLDARGDALPGRWYPTQRFGAEESPGTEPYLPRRIGSRRSRSRMQVSVSDPATLSNDDVTAIAAQLKAELRTCNARGLTCDVVDLRFSSDAHLHRYRTIVVPPFVRPPVRTIAARIARLRIAHVAIASHVPPERGTGITVLAGTHATFGLAVNWSNAGRRYGGRTWTGQRFVDVPAFTVAARDARLIVIAGPQTAPPALPALPAPERSRTSQIFLNARQTVDVDLPRVGPGNSVAIAGDAFGGGGKTLTLANARVFAIVVPDGGGRLVVFARRNASAHNVVNATGALRDDVLDEPPPSTTDRIAKYTHSYPAGTFNRPYQVAILATGTSEAVARLRYTAPDLGGGAHFEKTFRLAADETRLVVDEHVTFDGSDPAQRAVVLDAVAAGPSDAVALGRSFITSNRHVALAITWNPNTVQRATWTRYGSNGTLALVAASGALRTTFTISSSTTPAAIAAFTQAERDWLAANPNPP